MSLRTIVHASHAEALRRAREALQSQGFGVLCEIDIREKLREKLGVEFQRYVILGACNPPLAYEALQADPEIGLLLPCNVIVYEESDVRCVVAAVDPDAMMSVAGDNPRLQKVAADARARLEKAIASLQ
jgi:uncharacterized protein (DUF302 family)